MTHPWTPDVELSEDEVRRLLRAQHPDLADASLARLGQGWDNAAWAVGPDWVFRFPTRALRARGMRTEQRVLPRLARWMPVPISAPERLGRPDGRYPHPRAGYPRIDGETLCRAAQGPGACGALAVPLAHALTSLHHIPVTTAELTTGPRDLLRRMDLTFRGDRARRAAGRLPLADLGLDEARVQAFVDTWPSIAPWGRPPVWCHGDLYARHVVVDRWGGLQGLIDWGDIHLGDPAVDLSVAWSVLPAAVRPSFLEAYGPVDADTWQRARARAVASGLTLIGYGLEVGDAPLVVAGRVAVASALEG